jgi:hypothetical protein
VVLDAAADPTFSGSVAAQHGDEPGLIVTQRLSVYGRGQRGLVGEVVIQRPYTDASLLSDVIESRRRCTVDREAAPRHLQ